jgi:hypothetical protein
MITAQTYAVWTRTANPYVIWTHVTYACTAALREHARCIPAWYTNTQPILRAFGGSVFDYRHIPTPYRHGRLTLECTPEGQNWGLTVSEVQHIKNVRLGELYRLAYSVFDELRLFDVKIDFQDVPYRVKSAKMA